jgi:hypothetical protein
MTETLKNRAAELLVHRTEDAMRETVEHLLANAIKPRAKSLMMQPGPSAGQVGYVDLIEAKVEVDGATVKIGFMPQLCSMNPESGPHLAKAMEACKTAATEMFHSLGVPVHQGDILEISREKLAELMKSALNSCKEADVGVAQRAVNLADGLTAYAPPEKSTAAKSVA